MCVTNSESPSLSPDYGVDTTGVQLHMGFYTLYVESANEAPVALVTGPGVSVEENKWRASTLSIGQSFLPWLLQMLYHIYHVYCWFLHNDELKDCYLFK